MTPQTLLHVAEFSFQQIGRIRDAQLGETLAGKRPWQMPFQAVVRSAQALMCSVSGLFSVHAAFVQEGGVLLVPALERRFKRRLSKFPSGSATGPAAPVLPDFWAFWSGGAR